MLFLYSVAGSALPALQPFFPPTLTHSPVLLQKGLENFVEMWYKEIKDNLQLSVSAKKDGSDEDRTYYYYNCCDLKAIIDGTYTNYSSLLDRVKSDKYITLRQRATIAAGIEKLHGDIEEMNSRAKLY